MPDYKDLRAEMPVALDMTELVGRTPLLRLSHLSDPAHAQVLVKLESANPGGSLKDRVALAMINDAEVRGILKPGGTVLEPTSGNTGIGLAMVCAARGYKIVLVMPEDMSEERKILLQAYGAQLVLTPAAKLMAGALDKAKSLQAENPGWFMPGQFSNRANPEVHKKTTAVEIDEATEGQLDAFVAGVGTGGTITGVGEHFKEKGHPVRIIALEPAKSAVLSGGSAGTHRIQGIGAGFVPPVLNRSVIDEILTVEEEEAYRMTKQLARHEGLLVGISTGANVSAALKVAKRFGPGQRVVTLCCDMGERYFSLEDQFEKDLFRDGI